MRLLHTGDWHLGKRLFGIDRLGEARAVLTEVRELAAREEVDAILVAGDLLDRRLVDPATLGACLSVLEGLADVAPVVAVTGNHDDPELWSHLAPYLEPRIVVASRVRAGDDAVVSLDLPAGPLHVACLPWAEPSRMALPVGEAGLDARGAYADLLADVVHDHAAALRRRRRESGGAAVLLGHLMVERALAGGGERELTLGLTYAVSAAALPQDLDYIALGHVHRAQALPGLAAPGRYAGSPMALDFSEDRGEKGVALVELGRDGGAAHPVPLAAGRRLVRLRAPLEGLAGLAAEHPGAYFACEVELESVALDLVRQVRERVPDALRVEPRYAAGAAAAPGGGEGDEAPRTLAEHYAAWHEEIGRPLDRAVARAFAAAVAAAAPDGEER